MNTLKADKRENTKKANMELRDKGFIPAVFYGSGNESTAISVERNVFEKLLKEAGETTTINLKTEDGEYPVLIHDVQNNPVTGEPIHIDFMVVDLKKEVEVAVPLEFIGESPAEKLGGTVVKVMHEVEVKCLPNAIPHEIQVDLSTLKELHDIITLGDIKLPEGVTFTEDLESTVASIAEQKEESEEQGEVDLSSIEVEKKGKQEEATDGE